MNIHTTLAVCDSQTPGVFRRYKHAPCFDGDALRAFLTWTDGSDRRNYTKFARPFITQYPLVGLVATVSDGVFDFGFSDSERRITVSDG